MDARQRRTRDALFEALERLLEEVDYRQITVSALAERAQVGRQSFYRHFDSIDAMLEAQLRDGLAEQLRLARAHSPGEDLRSWVILLAILAFTHARERPRLYRLALDGPGAGRAIDLFSVQIEALMAAAEPGRDEPARDPLDRSYEAAFHAGAIFSLLRKWLVEGLSPAPEVMGEVFARLINFPKERR